MTETTTDRTLVWNTEERQVVNESVSVGATATTLLSAHDIRIYRDGSATIYNAGEAGDVTVRVWVNDKETAGTLGTASHGWAEYGTDKATCTIASGACTNIQWSGRYRWLGVTATVASSTGTVSLWAREYT